MIAAIQGKIIELDFTSITLMTSAGVGYKVGINEYTYSKISTLDEVFLHIYHHFTQDSQALFGFLEAKEKALFTELLKISGIGGKAGQSLLAMGYDKLIQAIAGNDTSAILDVKGIGGKTAEKIIIEMRDKDIVKTSYGESLKGKSHSTNALGNSLFNEIKTTLVALGYNEKSVEKILRNIPSELKTADAIVPYVIKQMG